jgi:Transposase DDE domain
MRFLRFHHITKLVAVVDSFLPRAAANPKGGRPLVLHPNETIALLLFSSMVAPQRTMQGIYTWAQTYYYRRFRLPAYSSFVRKCHQALPGMLRILDQLLVKDAPLRFMDSTMLHVCKLVRANRHRVAKGVAQFGKNWQGWHYGFKLHAAVNPRGQLAAMYFTPANEHNASVMRRKMWREHHAYILAPPHPKQNKKLMEEWQLLLLHKRAKVECTFDYLKEHLLLETSFPRSVQGYALHYTRVLLAYQLMWGF